MSHRHHTLTIVSDSHPHHGHHQVSAWSCGWPWGGGTIFPVYCFHVYYLRRFRLFISPETVWPRVCCQVSLRDLINVDCFQMYVPGKRVGWLCLCFGVVILSGYFPGAIWFYMMSGELSSLNLEFKNTCRCDNIGNLVQFDYLEFKAHWCNSKSYSYPQ